MPLPLSLRLFLWVAVGVLLAAILLPLGIMLCAMPEVLGRSLFLGCAVLATCLSSRQGASPFFSLLAGVAVSLIFVFILQVVAPRPNFLLTLANDLCSVLIAIAMTLALLRYSENKT